MFDSNSRYAGVETYPVIDHRGRQVTVVGVPPKPDSSLLGIHALREGERLDHLAQKYLNNPTGFWAIAERNDVMLAESLSERREIEIPAKQS
jgi:hypothetical protein